MMPFVPNKQGVIDKLTELSKEEDRENSWWEAARLVQGYLMVDTRRQLDQEILSIWTPEGWPA